MRGQNGKCRFISDNPCGESATNRAFTGQWRVSKVPEKHAQNCTNIAPSPGNLWTVREKCYKFPCLISVGVNLWFNSSAPCGERLRRETMTACFGRVGDMAEATHVWDDGPDGFGPYANRRTFLLSLLCKSRNFRCAHSKGFSTFAPDFWVKPKRTGRFYFLLLQKRKRIYYIFSFFGKVESRNLLSVFPVPRNLVPKVEKALLWARRKILLLQK